MGFALIHWTLPYKGNHFKAAIKGDEKGDPKAAPRFADDLALVGIGNLAGDVELPATIWSTW